MVLVTTALEETFPKNKDEKILFLGEWCKLYAKKDIYEQYDYETLPYHWDDREKLYEDTKYIDTVYEKYLEMLKDNLNKMHNVNFSISYWRIILGPWLRYFIEMVYDRYLSIEEASKMDIDYVNTIDINDEDIIPNDMRDFHNLYQDDLWNQFIYQNIISYFDISTKAVLKKKIVKQEKKEIKRTFSIRLFSLLFKLNKLNNIHFISSYIPLKYLNKLQLKLYQIPTFGQVENLKYDFIYSNKDRKNIIFENSENLFITILNNLLKRQIPKYYLEGYTKVRLNVLKVYPLKSKIIFTANAYASSDSFKFWVAEQKENGAKYIIGQHGGHYGMGLFSSHEEHQIKASDRFFSWGWNIQDRKSIVPVSAVKLQRPIKYNKDGDILVPLFTAPRYAYIMMAMPIANQVIDYINNQIKYISILPKDIRKLIKFRVHPHDYDWSFKERIIDSEIGNLIDNEMNTLKRFHMRLSECRLCIATYNATTYLETFSANYPTLLYWNPLHWELNDKAKPYFKVIENAGILHYTEESLALKLNEIYEDPLSWWLQDEVQYAKNEFCKIFANTDSDYIYDYKKEIGKLIDEK